MRRIFFVALVVVVMAMFVGVPTASAQIESIFYCGDPAFRGTTAADVGCRLEESRRYNRRYNRFYDPDPRVGYDRQRHLEICQYEECYGIRGTFHGHRNDGREEIHFRPFDETDKPIGTREGGAWGALGGAGVGAAIGDEDGAAIGAVIGAIIGGRIASKKAHDNCIVIESAHATGSTGRKSLVYSMVNRTGARVDLYKGHVIIHRFESGDREDFPPSDEYRAVIRLTANGGRENTRPAEIRPTRDGKSWEIIPKED